jgi:hypothetical protein
MYYCSLLNFLVRARGARAGSAVGSRRYARVLFLSPALYLLQLNLTQVHFVTSTEIPFFMKTSFDDQNLTTMLLADMGKMVCMIRDAVCTRLFFFSHSFDCIFCCL